MKSSVLVNIETKVLAENILNKAYDKAINEWSDIQEHVPKLKEYASRSTSILVCGVRTAISTWGFMKGLSENGCSTKKLVGVDLQDDPNVHILQNLA